MPPMALPLVDNSPFLLEGQCLHLPCHWTPVYEQNFCLRFPGSRRFEGMHPFVSHSRDLSPLSLRLPCARHELEIVTSSESWLPLREYLVVSPAVRLTGFARLARSKSTANIKEEMKRQKPRRPWVTHSSI
eukprot:Gb_33637 [translate_table: standard]